MLFLLGVLGVNAVDDDGDDDIVQGNSKVKPGVYAIFIGVQISYSDLHFCHFAMLALRNSS